MIAAPPNGFTAGLTSERIGRGRLEPIFPLSDGQLVLDGNVVDTTESPHTGRSLRRLESDLTVPAAEARLINTAFKCSWMAASLVW
jgi:hypothetical protein